MIFSIKINHPQSHDNNETLTVSCLIEIIKCVIRKDLDSPCYPSPQIIFSIKINHSQSHDNNETLTVSCFLEIIKCVIRKDQDPPFRPKVAKLYGSFDCVISCMQECWTEQPENRPDFKVINAKLRPMRRGMKPNIFDNMLAMMEKYANNLEALVDERTDQLNEEKRKTDALLYEMLP
ncbi:Speract receptor, partial [Araneus ventricosus]